MRVTKEMLEKENAVLRADSRELNIEINHLRYIIKMMQDYSIPGQATTLMIAIQRVAEMLSNHKLPF